MRLILPVVLLGLLLAACGGGDSAVSVDAGVADVPPFFLVARITVDDNGHVQIDGEPRRSEFR